MEKKHSGLGISSFIIGIATAILIFAEIVIAGMMEASTVGGIDEESPQAVILGLALFATMGMCLVGAGLGIAALFQKNRKKVFAILGIIFSISPFAIAILLMIIGLMAGA